MAVPRAALIGLVGAVLIAAAFFAARPGGDSEEPAGLPVAPDASPAPAASQSDAPDAAAAADRARERDVSDVPPQVERALEEGKVVVLSFFQAGAADDAATENRLRRLATAELDSPGLKRQVTVFRDSVEDVGDYSGVLRGLGITQAPAVVVVSRDQDARVLEGYSDRRSLQQHVADALR